MHTHVAPDFWRLHKNMNCAFPLRPDRIISYVNNLYYNLTNEPKLIGFKFSEKLHYPQ